MGCASCGLYRGSASLPHPTPPPLLLALQKLIEEKAVDAKVIFVPGSAFIAPDAGVEVPSSFVRAAFSTAAPEDMDEALARLAVLLRSAQ